VVRVQPAVSTAAAQGYLPALLDAKWWILATTAVGLLLGAFSAGMAPPIFQSDVLVQIEETERRPTAADDLSSLLTPQSQAETEMELLRSRTLLGSVIDEVGLDILAEPRRAPLIGSFLARRWTGAGVAPPRFGLSRRAWGGERIQIDRLQVPRALEGATLKLIAGKYRTYQLVGPSGQPLLGGEVSKTSLIPSPSTDDDSPDQPLEILVRTLEARPGTEFIVLKLPRVNSISTLQDALQILERGKSKTGILQISLQGEDQKRIARTVDAVANTYLRMNVERRSAEAERKLEFLNTQLPLLKANLDQAEAALNAYRSTSGRVDMTAATASALDRATEVEKSIQELELQRFDMRQRFKADHPVIISLQHKLWQLESDRASIDSRIKQLPAAELASARLTRDVQVSHQLYMILLNKAQELRVVKSGTIGNVRIIDRAIMTGVPVGPKRGQIAGLGTSVGLIIGIGIALGRVLRRGVQDPDVIEQVTGLPVYGNVPFSDEQAEFSRALRKKGHRAPILAAAAPDKVAVESLRSLRTSLQFSLTNARNHIISMTGSRPGVGKSFLSMNLAHVVAEMGPRVLLVDGDLRKGILHRYFGAEPSSGLSEALAGSLSAANVVRVRCAATKAHLIPRGQVPPNPAELLAGDHFRALIEDLATHYDLVIIDSPPVLAVTDAALIGRIAGINMIVMRSGFHALREITQTVKSLSQNGVRANGFILNRVEFRTGGYGGVYHYEYK
jgi:tyrosine-protein kinase Etk/Wzc